VSACGGPQGVTTQDLPTATTTAATPTPISSEDAAIEQVAAAGMEALIKLDWEGFAEVMHPEALQGFKDMLVSVLEAAGEQDRATQAGLVSLFYGAQDVQSVIALEPKEFFAGFMKGVVSQSPEMGEIFAGTDVEIIGTVHEGNDLAHVVFRMGISAEGLDVTSVDVVSLKRSGTDWRMLLTANIEGLAEQLKLAISDE